MKSRSTKKTLQARKDKLIERLEDYGIDGAIENMELLDDTRYEPVTPIDVAERLLILLAVAYSAYNFEENEKVMDWLKKEDLWKSVSEKEKEFFRNPDPDEEEKGHLSWRFEGAVFTHIIRV